MNRDQDEWTVVRYGRRRARPQYQQPRPKWRNDGWGNSLPIGGRTGSELPRGPRPQGGYPSYRRRQGRWDEPRATGRPQPGPRRGFGSPYPKRPPRTQRQQQQQNYNVQAQQQQGYNVQAQDRSTDPNFGTTLRSMYRLIKNTHHLQHVSMKEGQPQPPTIERLVDHLTETIKPSSPNNKTADLIKGNAKNWGYTTMLILREHYNAAIEEDLRRLTPDLTDDWPKPFAIATKWARGHLGGRLKQDTVDLTEAMMASCRTPDRDEDPGPPRPSTVSTHVTYAQVTQRTDTPQAPTHTTPRISTHTTSSQTTPTPLPSTPPPSTSLSTICPGATRRPPNTEPLDRAKKCAVATMTDAVSDWSPVAPGGTVPTPTVPQQHPSLVTTPKERRITRAAKRKNPCVVEDGSVLLEIESAGVSAALEGEPAPPLLDSPLTFGMDTNRVLVPKRTALISKQKTQTTQSTPTTRTQAPIFQPPSTKPLTFRTTRHVPSLKKMQEWSLSVRKKWLIIGDSNLARLPEHHIADLQIDSYPGANFRHAEAILEKATVCTVVEKVILSFGMNNKLQKAKETATKQLQRAYRRAKITFPHAEIWVPQINFSRSLPYQEQINLNTLNTHISNSFPHIPRLPGEEFHTEKDFVHWTRDTAKAMLQHWTTHLN